VAEGPGVRRGRGRGGATGGAEGGAQARPVGSVDLRELAMQRKEAATLDKKLWLAEEWVRGRQGTPGMTSSLHSAVSPAVRRAHLPC
jgi:hypothetical protein